MKEVDEYEFAQLLSERFNAASQHDSEVRYTRTGDQEHSLSLIYQSDKLVRAESGPSWTPADLDWLRERVAKDLLGPANRKIVRAIVFA